MSAEPEYRALLAVDIERSAGRGDVALARIREVLQTELRAAFGRSGVDWDASLRADLGDGVMVVTPAGTPKASLLHPLMYEFAVRLRAQNRLAGAPTRIRVRIALHAGDVHLAPDGAMTGRPLEVLARLLDSAPLRASLAEAPEDAPAALLVSGHFYEETVRHGYPGIDPDAFRRVAVTAKEYAADAWLHLPLHPAAPPPPAPAARPPEPGTEPGAAPGATMVNRASGHGVVYATQHGTQHIHAPEQS